MGKSNPIPPAAPDYAAANREGVYADIETLPMRRLIESASGSGKNIQYQTPKQLADYKAAIAAGGTPNIADYQTTADFTGLGDVDKAKTMVQMANETAGLSAQSQLDIGTKYGPQFQQLALDALKRQDPAGFAARQELAAGLRSDYAAPTDVSESQRSQLLRDAAIGQSLERRGGQGGPTVLSQLANLTALGQAGQGQGAAPETELSRLVRSAGISLAGQGNDYGLAGSAGSQQARDVALQRGIAEYNLGGQLSGDQQREIEQSVRGAAAARGQALSTSGAIKEVLGKYNMGEQVKQQRLQNLLNIGAQAFGQEQAAGQSQAQLAQTRLASLFGAQQAEYGQAVGDRGMTNQEAQQRLQNLFGAQQTEYGQRQSTRATGEQEAQQRLQNLFSSQQTQFGQEQAIRQETQQQQQRRLSNLQQYVLGAPISSQFQTLQGAQQSSSPYTPMMAQGIGQNANAGQNSAGFAGNIFGTQANIYKTQEEHSGSPYAPIIGSVLGAAAGSAFGAGGMFGKAVPKG